MIKQWSYRKKLKYMAIPALLMVFICYRFSISKTLTERKIYREAKKTTGMPVNMNTAQLLESRKGMLDKVISQYQLDTLTDSEKLLALTGDYCEHNDLTLKEYKPGFITQLESLRILTRVITLEGGFTNCLKFIYQLENNPATGRVSSVLFKSYQDPTTSTTILNCTIQVQNIISTVYDKK